MFLNIHQFFVKGGQNGNNLRQFNQFLFSVVVKRVAVSAVLVEEIELIEKESVDNKLEPNVEQIYLSATVR